MTEWEERAKNADNLFDEMFGGWWYVEHND
jgi:hypothetical protein